MLGKAWLRVTYCVLVGNKTYEESKTNKPLELHVLVSVYRVSARYKLTVSAVLITATCPLYARHIKELLLTN
jgi:hypothetical protein